MSITSLLQRRKATLSYYCVRLGTLYQPIVSISGEPCSTLSLAWIASRRLRGPSDTQSLVNFRSRSLWRLVRLSTKFVFGCRFGRRHGCSRSWWGSRTSQCPLRETQLIRHFWSWKSMVWRFSIRWRGGTRYWRLYGGSLVVVIGHLHSCLRLTRLGN